MAGGRDDPAVDLDPPGLAPRRPPLEYRRKSPALVFEVEGGLERVGRVSHQIGGPGPVSAEIRRDDRAGPPVDGDRPAEMRRQTHQGAVAEVVADLGQRLAVGQTRQLVVELDRMDLAAGKPEQGVDLVDQVDERGDLAPIGEDRGHPEGAGHGVARQTVGPTSRVIGQRQVGPPDPVAEQVARGHRAVRGIGRQELGSREILADGRVFLTDPAEQVACLGVEPLLAIEPQGAVDLAGRLERPGRRRDVLEPVQIEESGVAVQAGADQEVSGGRKVVEELTVDIGRSTEIPPSFGLFGGLAVLLGQLDLDV